MLEFGWLTGVVVMSRTSDSDVAGLSSTGVRDHWQVITLSKLFAIFS